MKQLSEKIKSEARKSGKLPKAPKKPSKSASLTALAGYKRRYETYVKKIEELARKTRQRDILIRQVWG
jgi:hypothetical protein